MAIQLARVTGRLVTTFTSVVVPCVLSAQHVDRVAAEDLRRGAARSQISGSRGSLAISSRDGNAQYLYNRREQPSEIEMHCAWDDLFFVQSGYGQIETSTTLRKRVRIAAGEWRAERIGAKRVAALEPGDFIRVPAGTGHAIAPTGDVPLVYLVVKVRSSNSKACSAEMQR